MDSADAYAARIDACAAQNARLTRPGADRWASRAAMFNLDPRRPLEANTAAVAALVASEDSVIDVGGGAGRVCLPIALNCREVINVEPSAGMREQFEIAAREAGITNARCLDGGWPAAATGLQADVVMLANVTYFVRDIVPFIQALDRTARKRVVIAVWSVPPPNHSATLFELLHGEPQERVPTHRELLAVLWDLGLLPSLQLLPDPFRGGRMRPPTPEDGVKLALQSASAEHLEGARGIVEAHFAELFEHTAEGYVPRWMPDAREMLITWEPRG